MKKPTIRNVSRPLPRTDNLVEHLESAATWKELVLPKDERQRLMDLAEHMKKRSITTRSFEHSGTALSSAGVIALFSGPSATGNTLAAKVLANDLDLPLFRVDLGSIVSKYIGETEKNLQQVFVGAENAGAILFFDEADALLGKRTEATDAHDRYDNQEVSYLLQRMETYQGLCILSSNMKTDIDPTLLRRIQFVIQIPR